MNILEQGYEVIYEDQALAFTEAPVNANGLARQRFRWSFGILQAIFKHQVERYAGTVRWDCSRCRIS